MNETKQRIAIAEACGWTKCKCSPTWCENWMPPGKKAFRCAKAQLPDYLNNLDAMHEAVETLRFKDGAEWYDYRTHLANICGSMGNCIQASAAQRAEAFLKTLGLWEEG